MATTTERELWDKLDALNAEKAKLHSLVVHLEAEKEQVCQQRNALNVRAENLANKINGLTFPRMAEICKDIAILSAALSGRTRPEGAGNGRV